MKPTITIEYCPKCNWLARAAWMSQELLTTFNEELEGVKLKPSETSGRYDIHVGNDLLFSRKREGHFPEIKELKILLRDKVAPNKSLGHTDRASE